MGDAIVVMKDGRIEQVGSPLELYDHPANMFVAGFIGSPAMNFLPGDAEPQRRRSAPRASTTARSSPRPRGAAGGDGQSVVLGTRPEHLQLAAEGGIASRVVVLEPTGADTLRRLPARRHRHGSPSSASATSSRPAARSISCPICTRAHLFDAGSGARLAA